MNINYLCICILFILFFSSGASKFTAYPLPPPEKWNIFDRINIIGASVWFGIFEILLSLILLINPTIMVTFSAIIITFLCVSLGLTARKLGTIKSCRCFGTFTPKNKWAVDFLALSSLIISTYLIIEISNFNHPQNSNDIDLSICKDGSYKAGLIWLSLSLGLTGLFIKKLRDEYINRYSSDTDGLDPFPKDMIIGHFNGISITIGLVMKPNLPCLFIKISDGCGICHNLFPQLLKWVELHINKLPIVIITDSPEKAQMMSNHQKLGLSVVYDPHFLFEQHLHILGAPLAILLNGSTGEILSPIVRNPDGIFRLAKLSYEMAIEEQDTLEKDYSSKV